MSLIITDTDFSDAKCPVCDEPLDQDNIKPILLKVQESEETHTITPFECSSCDATVNLYVELIVTAVVSADKIET